MGNCGRQQVCGTRKAVSGGASERGEAIETRKAKKSSVSAGGAELMSSREESS